MTPSFRRVSKTSSVRRFSSPDHSCHFFAPSGLNRNLISRASDISPPHDGLGLVPAGKRSVEVTRDYFRLANTLGGALHAPRSGRGPRRDDLGNLGAPVDDRDAVVRGDTWRDRTAGDGRVKRRPPILLAIVVWTET